jgi:peptidoglycan-associated lipoprotein
MLAAPTEDAMKITSLALIVAALIGCHHDKAKVAPTTPIGKADKPAPKEDAPSPPITADQKVSPNLALSGDVVAMCGIKAQSTTANAAFDYNKDELTPEDRGVLDQLATCLTSGALKGKAVALIGRADPRGTEEYNLGLGSRRAASVSSYLERLGVGQPQLAVSTRGALDATGTDETGWSKDRRVDVQLKQD